MEGYSSVRKYNGLGQSMIRIDSFFKLRINPSATIIA
jgi:hypothetical protein